MLNFWAFLTQTTLETAEMLDMYNFLGGQKKSPESPQKVLHV